MEGENIELIISGWSSSELRKKALDELVEMREKIARQLSDLSKYEVRHEVDIRKIERLQNILQKEDNNTQKRNPGWKTFSEIVRGLTAPSSDVTNVNAVSASCPRCGLTFSEPLGVNDFCSCDAPDFAPFLECQHCGKPPRF